MDELVVELKQMLTENPDTFPLFEEIADEMKDYISNQPQNLNFVFGKNVGDIRQRLDEASDIDTTLFFFELLYSETKKGQMPPLHWVEFAAEILIDAALARKKNSNNKNPVAEALFLKNKKRKSTLREDTYCQIIAYYLAKNAGILDTAVQLTTKDINRWDTEKMKHGGVSDIWNRRADSEKIYRSIGLEYKDYPNFPKIMIQKLLELEN